MSAINYLFDSWSFKLPLPKPFENVNKRQGAKSTLSSDGTMATLHGPTLKALIWYKYLCEEGKGPENVNGQMAAYGTKDNGRFEVSEILPEDPSLHCRCVVIDTASGSVFGSKYDVATDTSSAYELGPEKDDGAAVVFAAITMLMRNSKELQDHFFEFSNQFKPGSEPQQTCLNEASICCDNIYRQLNDQNSPVKITSSNLGRLTPMAIGAGAYAPDNAVFGEFHYLDNGSTASAIVHKPATSHDRFIGKYKFGNRVLTDEEKALVPDLPDWYVIPKQVETVCEHAQLTTGCPMAMRNFLLRGPAGTGKTEGAKAIAAGIGLPYVKYTCSANSEIYDFIGQVIPVMDDDKGDKSGTVQTASNYNITGSDIANHLNLPSYMEIRNDPVTAYEEITGTANDNATPEECYAAAIRKVAVAMQKMISSTQSNGAQQYRYVDTPFIKAIKNGWLCEIQEPTVIIQPGVLVGLNGLLDPDGDIFLPTGETIKRHPDAMVIVTTNTDYAGCRDMNQSVISRMHLVIDMMEPDEDIMTQRVLNLTGCQDEDMVRKMVGVVHSIEKHCQENDISDGTCGIRELTAWVISTDRITHNPYESALSTILSKASADPESQESIRTNCLLPIFSKKTRQRRTA